MAFIHNAKIAAKLMEVAQNKKKSINHGNVPNFFIVYKLDTWSRELNTSFTRGDCLLMLILINMDIVVMVLDLMLINNFHCEMENFVKKLLFLL